MAQDFNAESYYKIVASRYPDRFSITAEGTKELYTHCPFHSDRKRSFSIDRAKGLWTCFGCGKAGNITTFHTEFFKVSKEEAEKQIKRLVGIEKVVDPKEVEDRHQALLKNKEVIKWCKEKRMWELETLKKFKLGWDGTRIWIPIEELGDYVNVRKYIGPNYTGTQEKMVSYGQGFGELRLFPYSNLKHDRILLLEGEPDTILANQLGYNGLSVTGGSGSFKQSWIPLFRDKYLTLCYDTDAAGKTGATKIASLLAPICKELRMVELPLDGVKSKDFTDYIRIHKAKGRSSFEALVSNSGYFEITKKSRELENTVHDTTLSEASDQKYYYKRVRMNILVSGKDLAPYLVPKEVHVTCPMTLKKCPSCGLSKFNGDTKLIFDELNPDLLKMVQVTDEEQKLLMKKRLAMVPCHLPEFEVEKVFNLEEVKAIPEVEFSERDQEYVVRKVFSIGHGIKTNHSYTMEGITLPDPNTQYATQLVYDAKPSQVALDQFKLDDKMKEALKIFQSKNPKEKFAEIHRDFTYNVTKIYGREDLLQAIDFVYHSVIQFSFLNRYIQKGWVEGLIIGDTRCGKSESIQQIISHYRTGELVTGENASFAGLIGGMQQTQNRWSITWGKIPLNDRRLVVIDEVSGMGIEDISLMSGVRSSGVAEITKIQTERTHARTRILWLSNPRSGRKLDTYNHGVLAVRELIGKVEDCARLDFAVTAASGEVGLNQINSIKHTHVPHKYTSELCHNLVLWVWSRTKDQVRFTKPAIKLILLLAGRLGAKYTSSIPLVEPNEERIKLARLSVSIAGRLFSTDSTGEILVVDEMHVRYAYEVLGKFFDKASMGYDVYSTAVKKSTELDDPTRIGIAQEFKLFTEWETLRDVLLEAHAFRKTELLDQIGYDKDTGASLFRWLTKNKLIKATPIGYVKQPGFTEVLKIELQGVSHGSPSGQTEQKKIPN